MALSLLGGCTPHTASVKCEAAGQGVCGWSLPAAAKASESANSHTREAGVGSALGPGSLLTRWLQGSATGTPLPLVFTLVLAMGTLGGALGCWSSWGSILLATFRPSGCLPLTEPAQSGHPGRNDDVCDDGCLQA